MNDEAIPLYRGVTAREPCQVWNLWPVRRRCNEPDTRHVKSICECLHERHVEACYSHMLTPSLCKACLKGEGGMPSHNCYLTVVDTDWQNPWVN